MTATKKVRALNERLAQELGRAPNGQPKWGWVRATELPYFLRDGQKEVRPKGMLVSLVVPTYKRLLWADRINQHTDLPFGKSWILANWKVPELTQREWEQSFGSAYPYPAGGMYYARPEIWAAENDPPDDDLTEYVIIALKAQMGKTYADHYFEGKAVLDQEMKERKQYWRDVVDEDWPAFDNPWPGKRGGHVSFGGI